MKRAILWMVLGLTLSMVPPKAEESAVKEPKPVIQMAILLDTSNSMDGLINQARSQLWQIVNTFVTARHNGVRPDLQVALYHYGTPSLGADNGYIRCLLPFTDDLDKVSEELFKLTTNGGDEYCGWVIQRAVRDLKWSDAKNAYKVIYIAGNEPFTQGTVNYRESCKEAVTKGIIVNTIHCGSAQEGEQGEWKNGALIADGKFLNIDQNQAVVQINAPQDAEITKLSGELNGTYVAFGAEGAKGKMRQEAQEANAMQSGASSFAQRQASKSSGFYRNGNWDLVDAVNDKQVELKDVKEAELPEELRKMTLEERKAYVAEQTKRRAEIQDKINTLNVARSKYVAEEQKKQAAAPAAALDAAVQSSARAQAESAGYKF
jgi:hypothetical protein